MNTLGKTNNKLVISNIYYMKKCNNSVYHKCFLIMRL